MTYLPFYGLGVPLVDQGIATGRIRTCINYHLDDN